jgi:hypothetical protein
VRPDLPNDDSLFAEMFRLDVSIVRAGGEIALPSPTDRCALFRHWVEPPRCGYRPSGQLILESIRHLTRGTSTRDPRNRLAVPTANPERVSARDLPA